MHRYISIQEEPTGCTIYFQFISIINLYVFRAGLVLIRTTKYFMQFNDYVRGASGK